MLQPSHPVRFFVSYHLRKMARHGRDLAKGVHFADSQEPLSSSSLVIRHQSPVLRKLKGVDPQLQQNKRTNLEIVARRFDGLLIKPGEVFSFWQRVGVPTKERGFKPGLVIKSGRPDIGIGGGLCQLSNALFWCFLHTEVELVERHRHSFDLFPDDERQVPFGLGAGVAYGVKDLRIANTTDVIFQIKMSVEGDQLVVQLNSNRRLNRTFKVKEIDSKFYRKEVDTRDLVFRKNRVVRECSETGEQSTLFENDFECRYDVDVDKIQSDC